MRRIPFWILILTLVAVPLAAFIWPGWWRYDYDPDGQSRIDNLTNEVEVRTSHGWRSLGVHQE